MSETAAATQQYASDAQIFRGWIAAPEASADTLRELGIRLGKYNSSNNQFENCEATDEALERLDPYFGRFVFFFEEVLTQTLTVSITGQTVSEIEEALRSLAAVVRQQPEGARELRLQKNVDMNWRMRPVQGSAEEESDAR
jgi:hypothetical protein